MYSAVMFIINSDFFSCLLTYVYTLGTTHTQKWTGQYALKWLIRFFLAYELWDFLIYFVNLRFFTLYNGKYLICI